VGGRYQPALLLALLLRLALPTVATTLAALVRLVGLAVPDSASSCSAGFAMPGHVSRNAANGRAFEASFGLCRSAAYEGAEGQNRGCDDDPLHGCLLGV